MFNNKTKFKIEINKDAKHCWNLGINLIHFYDETYITICLFKRYICIGKMYYWECVETNSDF